MKKIALLTVILFLLQMLLPLSGDIAIIDSHKEILHFDPADNPADSVSIADSAGPALKEDTCLFCPPGFSGYVECVTAVYRPVILAFRSERPPRIITIFIG